MKVYCIKTYLGVDAMSLAALAHFVAGSATVCGGDGRTLLEKQPRVIERTRVREREKEKKYAQRKIEIVLIWS
jgi:hypothetical protein